MRRMEPKQRKEDDLRFAICDLRFGGQRSRPRTRLGGLCAFTLIEMVGVLAIIAILASIMVPVVIRQIDRAAWTKEVSDLSAISNALVLQALRGHSIPDSTAGPTGWGQAVGSWLNRPASQITSTPRNFARVFLIDPSLSSSGLGLPYHQTGNFGLTNPPTNSRLIIVSTLAVSDPPVSSGASLSVPDFQAIWDTPQSAKPATSMKWPMNGDDICIQRINLEPLFYQLLLVNRWSDANATFSIDANNPTNVAAGGFGYSSYYLDSTVVNLSSNNLVEACCLLKRNTSFVFENGAWQGQVISSPPSTNQATLFAISASLFFNAPLNPLMGGKGSSQSAVLGAMYNYMLDYTMWANTAFSTLGGSPMDQLMSGGAGDLNNYTGSGKSGLLYIVGGP
jgi:prepilin-type N-terminal cleavage/methylation domain-containing protein